MRKLILAIAAFLICISLYAQKGYPERTNVTNLYENFVNPPEGYGQVPFYWWQGDTITRDRLAWHLDEMAKNGHISSLQINYSHTDDKKGYFWGSSLKSQPEQFTDEWWDLFIWFVQEAANRNMTVSVSDYTLGIGQGYAFDEVIKLHPDMVGEKLKFHELKQASEGIYEMPQVEKIVSVAAYCGNEHIDLTDKVENGRLKWPKDNARQWKIIVTSVETEPKSFNPMHPLAGKEYVRCFFQRFEDRLPAELRGSLNFFFSDELNFNMPALSWDSRFADEFMKRKGYDIRPLLPALTMEIGELTTQVRLDYNDVFTSLSEENYFIPVYQWHADRGLLYGCDHGGRGARVDEFGDYFRTQRWNQGPGSDQPGLSKNVVKAKVAASIAHLYDRPRVWLEGFYSSGWGTSTENLMDAIFANYAMGYNLLSLHGLYYATPDSRWEWAPPCNHFRMPYWTNMDKLLECTERLSYLLSQGYHKCDIGIIYPVEPTIAGFGNTARDVSFKVAQDLYASGIDFDFIDYSSMAEAQIEGKEILIGTEKYKAIVVPPMEVMNDNAKQKLQEFESKGGRIINLKKDFDVESLIATLDKDNSRDFKMMHDTGRKPFIHHRKIDDKDLYAVYDVDKNTPCFFRAKGDVELWDPLDGQRYKLKDVQPYNDGTIVKMPNERSAMQLIVFTPHSNEQLLENTTVSQNLLIFDV